MPLLAAFALAAFALGLLFGSFLNVCISRLPAHRSIVQPRSSCQQCGHLIRWYDNVPLLSWFLLRGRCRDCGAAITWRYPAVELATGLWFTASMWLSFGPLLGLAAASSPGASVGATAGVLAAMFVQAVSLSLLGFLLLGLMVMDWQTHSLPDAFTLMGTLLGFLLLCAQAAFLPYGTGDIKLHPRRSLRLSSPGSFAAKGNVFLTGTESIVFGRLLAIAGAALVLLLIRWLYFLLRGRKRRTAAGDQDVEAQGTSYGLGLGDVKLLAMMAAFLGFWPAMLGLLIGVCSCSLYALVLLGRRRAGAMTQLPLGSFLCFGGLITAVFGESWLTWYRSLL